MSSVIVFASRASTDSPLSEIFIAENEGFPAVIVLRRLGSCRSLKSLIPIFPNRFEPATTEDRGDFGRGTFITDLKLSGRELIFAVLILRRDDPATHGAMKMFATLAGVTTGLGVAAGAHHGYSDRGERIAERRPLACAEHDPNLRERDAQCAHELHKLLVGHRE